MPENLKPEGCRFELQKQDSWLKPVSDGLPLLIIAAATPGALIIFIYAIRNDFLSYLLADVSILEFVFASAIIAFVFTIGLIVAAGSLLWLFIFVRRPRYIVTSTFHLLRITPASESHPFLPDTVGERLIWAIPSFMSLMLVVLFVIGERSWPNFFLVTYFLIIAFTLIIIMQIDNVVEKVRLRQTFMVLPLGVALLFIFPETGTILLNIFMTTLGFRSSVGTLVLIDDEAEQVVEQRAELYDRKSEDCPIQLPGRHMWYLPRGLVVWHGPGDLLLIKTDRSSDGIISLRHDQVLTTGRRDAVMGPIGTLISQCP